MVWFAATVAAARVIAAAVELAAELAADVGGSRRVVSPVPVRARIHR